MVKEVLNKGSVKVTDLGIFGEIGEENGAVGFNVPDKTGSVIMPDKTSEYDPLMTELTDMLLSSINEPLSPLENSTPQEKQKRLIKSRRDILQLFNIKVIIYPERVEIRGSLPTQFLDKASKKEPDTALIITSPCLRQRKGEEKGRGANAPLGRPVFRLSTVVITGGKIWLNAP